MNTLFFRLSMFFINSSWPMSAKSRTAFGFPPPSMMQKFSGRETESKTTVFTASSFVDTEAPAASPEEEDSARAITSRPRSTPPRELRVKLRDI